MDNAIMINNFKIPQIKINSPNDDYEDVGYDGELIEEEENDIEFKDDDFISSTLLES